MKKKLIMVICALLVGYLGSYEANANPKLDCSINQNENLQEVQVQNTTSAYVTSTSRKIVKITDSISENRKYTLGDLSNFNNTDLVDLLSKLSWENINDLYKYNGDSYKFYSNRARVEFLIEALNAKAKIYTADDDKGIDTLVEVLRAGFYLGYYNQSLNYLNDRSFHDKCIPAMIAIEENENFKLGEKGQDKVIYALAKLIGNASCNEKVVNNISPIFEQYYQNISDYSYDNLKGEIIHKFMTEVNYDIDQYKRENNNSDIWDSKIDKFINGILKFASIRNINDENGWLIRNAIYYTGKYSEYYSDEKTPHSVICDCLESLPKESEQYIQALNVLKDNFNSEDCNGNIIDVNANVEDIKNSILCKKYSFDNGKIIIKTGDKVKEDKVKRLYWASKEVMSQFFRTIGNDKPLELNHPDDVLTIVIYNSPEQYKLNRNLYGYSIDNGGIYIESIGTFFTYERTENESIYSLEELFRHEFTHYLQGRYLIPGYFGTGDFYKKNDSRITWFEEGTAEFFAGSTRNTVLPRKSIVSGLDLDKCREFDVYTTLHSKYSDGWDFYKYGCAFTDYMFNKNKQLFNQLVESMKKNDVKAYDRLIDYSSNDPYMNRSYQNHVRELINNKNNYNVPLVSDDYLEMYEPRNIEQIKSDIENSIGTSCADINIEKSKYFNAYTIKGKYVLLQNRGDLENWSIMNNKINDSLDKLSNLGWGGYNTVTAYFCNPQINSRNQVEYDVVFHGLLSNNWDENTKAVVKINAPNKANENEEITLTSNVVINPNSKIVSYKWDFGDGNESIDTKPVHAYSKAGRYSIKLQITDDKGVISENTVNIDIVKKINFTPVNEKEENGKFSEANKINIGNSISGSVDNLDCKDNFLFNLKKSDKVTIKLKTDQNNKNDCNWLLFDKNDINNYIAYAHWNGNVLSKVVDIKEAGEYYILVYSTSNKKVSYVLDITSENPDNNTSGEEDETIENDDDNQNTKPDKEYTVIKENETNNDMKSANLICRNQIIKANLNNDDNRDTYSIDVIKEGIVNIRLDKNSGNANDLNWLVYSIDDVNNYIAYPSKNTSNVLEGNFKADKAGRYYIVVYKTSGNNVDYSLKVDGKINNAPKNDVVKEKEENDSFDKAQKINMETPIEGSIGYNDIKDVYQFELEDSKEVSIALNNLNSIGMTWQLYSSEDLKKYISYGIQKDNYITRNITLKPGKYYIYVYKYDEGNGNYSLIIK